MRKENDDGKRFRYCVARRAEGRTDVDHGGRIVQIPDPELVVRNAEHSVRNGVALKVGRHSGQLGIVYLVRVEKKRARSGRGGGRITERGLVEWDEKTAKSLIKAVARMALEYKAVHKPPAYLVDALEKAWRNLPMWRELILGNELGEKIEEVRAVMEG